MLELIHLYIFSASSTCAKCLSPVSIHHGFEKGRRKEANYDEDQNACASRTSNK